jgi:Protein of unknown function (DUF2752)
MEKLAMLVWAALPVLGWVLPPDYLDGGVSKCPSLLFFQTPCPFCGLSRATLHAMHFQFKDAFEFNKLIIITFPACVVLFFHVLGLIIKRPMFTFIEKAYKREKK